MESKHRIGAAFVKELETKELSQIKVSDICKAAEINRSTFYSSYEDIYDLARSLQNSLEELTLKECGRTLEDGTVYFDFYKLFQNIYKAPDYYGAYYKVARPEHSIFDVDYTKELYKNAFDDDYSEYHAEFFQAGLNRLIKLWIDDGLKMTPEDMIQIIHNEYQGRIDIYKEF